MPAKRCVYGEAQWHSLDITVLQIIFPVDVPQIDQCVQQRVKSKITETALKTDHFIGVKGCSEEMKE